MTGRDEERNCWWEGQEQRHRSEESLVMVGSFWTLVWLHPRTCWEADGQQVWGGRRRVLEALLGQERCFYSSVSSGVFLNWKIASNILLFEKCFHKHGYIFNLDRNPAG